MVNAGARLYILIALGIRALLYELSTHINLSADSHRPIPHVEF